MRGGSFNAGAGSVLTHTLSLGSSATAYTSNNVTVNGMLDLNTTAGVTATFGGSLNATLGGTGGIADFYAIVLNKGTGRSAILDVGRVITLATPPASGKFLTLTSGTLRISSASGLVPYRGSQTICEAPARLWIANAGASVQSAIAGTATGAGAPAFDGELQIDAGSFAYGSGNNSAAFGADGDLVINGGTMTIYGRIGFSNTSRFTMTGGALNIDPQAANALTTASSLLGLANTTAVDWSGGTITFVDPHSTARGVSWSGGSGLGPCSITGGTLRFGDGVSTSSGGALSNTSGFGINTNRYLPHIVVNNRTDASASRMLRVATLNAIDLTVMTNGYIFNGSGIADGQLNLSSFLVNNGTVGGTIPGGTTALGALSFGPYNGDQSISGAGSWVNNPNLLLSNSGHTFTMANTGMLRVNSLSHATGLLDPGANFTIGNCSSAAGEVPVVRFGRDANPWAPPSYVSFPVLDESEGRKDFTYSDATASYAMGDFGESGPGVQEFSGLSIRRAQGLSIPVTITPVVTGALTVVNGSPLNLNGGILTLGTSTSAGILNAGTTGTIIGKFRRWIMTTTGNSEFPIGTALARRAAQIDYTVPPAVAGTLTVEWIPAAGGNNGLPLMEGSISVDRTASDGYWSVTAGDGLTGGTYTAGFNANSITGLTDYTKLVLLKRANASAAWTLDGAHVTTTGSNTMAMLRRTGMSGFSEFGIGSSADNPLPLRLLSFSGRLNSLRQTDLSWTVPGEKDVLGYVVERSAGGNGFADAGTVPACGSGSYIFTDELPGTGRNLYRLKIVKALDYSYSRVIAIEVAGGSRPELHPNPASGSVLLTLDDPRLEGTVATLYAADGTVAGSYYLRYPVTTINLTDVRPGAYYLRLRDGRSLRFTRQ